jgi:AcrR family transcriptional regulator
VALGTTGTEADLLAASDRDRLLAAMAESCAERGYRATTVADVLRRSGLGAEAFAAHFTSKEDCALAALNQLLSEAVARVSIAAPAGAAEPERRRAEAVALVELVASAPAFARLAQIEARHGASDRLAGAYRSARHVLGLMSAGGGEPDPGAVAVALGGAEALARAELAAGRGARLGELAENFVYVALVGTLGQGEALRQAKLAAAAAGREQRE